MSIALRVLLGYFLIVGLAVFFVMNVFVDEIKPGVRQSTEETLVETANLLAELVADELRDGALDDGRWKRAVDAYSRRELEARISGVSKTRTDLRIYVTDDRGIVLYDSTGKDVGADYSRWNDVWLTLRGRYGARTTRTDPDNELSSVMHVAAPVRDGERIVGVVTVAKPNLSVQPFIEVGRGRLLRAGVVLVLLALAVGIGASFWMSRSVNAVVRYADGLAEGRRLAPPALGGELGRLARAVTELREKLDGKTYVEEYVQAFLHELKGPLAAIYGAAELLEGEMSPDERERFLGNIQVECQRLRQILDRLLELARLEHRRTLDTRVPIAVRTLGEELHAANAALLTAGGVAFENRVPPDTTVAGDPFLVRQALSSLLDNAIQFSPPGGAITLSAGGGDGRVTVSIHNTGSSIPEFAAPRLFERFYSLPRPRTGQKSSGLGLAFVREVASLHGGDVRVENAPQGGVAAHLVLPAA
jgi:two-component system sensor histidine kinase CreC